MQQMVEIPTAKCIGILSKRLNSHGTNYITANAHQ